MAIVNTRLLSHPMNWVIIFVMLVIAAIFGHLLLSILDQEPSTTGAAVGLPNGLSVKQATA
jgi:hypothetical protein